MEPKLKVFLSSAQFNDEFLVEREGLPAIFSKQPLSSTFILWRIEDTSSPDDIKSHYIKHVNDSDIFILLLGKTLREGVNDEYQIAISRNIPIFAFEKKLDTRDVAMNKFIDNIKSHSTYTSYSSFAELVDKIENSISQYFFKGAKQEKILRWRDQHSKRKDSYEERSLRLLVGILSSETAVISKYQVIKSLLIEAALFFDKPKSIEVILKYAMDMVQLDRNKYKTEFSDVFELLIKSGDIIIDKDDLIELKPDLKENYIKNRIAQEKSDQELLLELYERNLPSINSINFNLYKRIVTNVISQVVYDTAVNMAEQEFGLTINPFSYNSDEINRIVSDAILNVTVQNKINIGEWQPIIVSILQSDDPKVIKWLNRLRKAYWTLTILGIDPSAVECIVEHLKNYFIYLDSHIVLRAMVEAGGESTICSQILKINRSIGIEMRISHSLFLEIKQAFYSANKAYYSSGMDIPRAIKFLKGINRKSDILDGFILAKAQIPDLSWENFINRFYSLSNNEKLEKYLLNELGIYVQPEQYFTTEQLGRIEDIVQRLLQVRRQMVHPPVNIDNGKMSEWERQYLLRTNEARQMAIIYELRRDGITHGKQYWFVTFDQFVYEVNTALFSSDDDEIYRFPCYMKPAIWLEIIVNASPIPLSINVFREILLSRDIQQIADQIETEVISQMLKSRVDKGIENIETLRLMFDDLVNRPAVQEAYLDVINAEGIQKLAASDKFKDSIINEMKEKLESLKEELSIKSIEAENERKKAIKAEGKAKYLKSQVGRLTSKKKRK